MCLKKKTPTKPLGLQTFHFILCRYFRRVRRRQWQSVLPQSQRPLPAKFFNLVKSREITLLRITNSRYRDRLLLWRGVTKERGAMETVGNRDLVIYYKWNRDCPSTTCIYVLFVHWTKTLGFIDWNWCLHSNSLKHFKKAHAMSASGVGMGMSEWKGITVQPIPHF